MKRWVICIAVVAFAVSCGRNSDGRLSSGPDEFSVVPGKPLQMPANFSALPAPTPGAGNLADANPRADAIAVLGGNPSRMVPHSASAPLAQPKKRRGWNPFRWR